jgi:hypothetical protein
MNTLFEVRWHSYFGDKRGRRVAVFVKREDAEFFAKQKNNSSSFHDEYLKLPYKVKPFTREKI